MDCLAVENNVSLSHEQVAVAGEKGETEERICRYCFEEEGDDIGELISPCKCSGGQKWVHVNCLRRWQRMVLVSQPTHPAYYKDDLRQQKCNVCLAEYMCPPPTRGELMASFTGPEIAALIEPGRVIVSRDTFNTMLEETDATARALTGGDHWIRGVYLITTVEADPGERTFTITDPYQLRSFRSRLNSNLEISLHGVKFKIVNAGSLSGVSSSLSELSTALNNLSVPATIILGAANPITCSDDHITAVNLTRMIPKPPRASLIDQAVNRVKCIYPGVDKVQISNYLGGPCEDDEIVTCIVTGGMKQGWTVVPKLDDALILAYSRGARRYEGQGDIGGGQSVRVKNLQSRQDLNGMLGVAIKFDEASGRWQVYLQNGDGIKIKPANLDGLEGPYGRVFVFWGDARWTRVQLLGEIARGHWGLCRAGVSEIINEPSARWGYLQDGRLAFAPITEMTEDSIRNSAQHQMESYRANAVRAAQTASDHANVEDD